MVKNIVEFDPEFYESATHNDVAKGLFLRLRGWECNSTDVIGDLGIQDESTVDLVHRIGGIHHVRFKDRPLASAITQTFWYRNIYNEKRDYVMASLVLKNLMQYSRLRRAARIMGQAIRHNIREPDNFNKLNILPTELIILITALIVRDSSYFKHARKVVEYNFDKPEIPALGLTK